MRLWYVYATEKVACYAKSKQQRRAYACVYVRMTCEHAHESQRKEAHACYETHAAKALAAYQVAVRH